MNKEFERFLCTSDELSDLFLHSLYESACHVFAEKLCKLWELFLLQVLFLQSSQVTARSHM